MHGTPFSRRTEAQRIDIRICSCRSCKAVLLTVYRSIRCKRSSLSINENCIARIKSQLYRMYFSKSSFSSQWSSYNSKFIMIATSPEIQEEVVVEPPAMENPSRWASFIQALNWMWAFFNAYDFPILLLAAIGVAKASPEFGAVHLAPQYTATWIAVALIFCKFS